MQTSQSILVVTGNPSESLNKLLGISLESNHVDYLKVEPDKSVGIDEVRTVQSFASHPPIQSKEKIILILDSHTLTQEAQNALLKILEEPPSYLKIILTASHLQNFTETLLSRCQIIRDLNSNQENLKSTGILSQMLSLPLPARLNLITEIKTKEAAISYCQTLINDVLCRLYDTPSKESVKNLELFHLCLNNLSKNANPAMILSDTVLQLDA